MVSSPAAFAPTGAGRWALGWRSERKYRPENESICDNFFPKTS
jgi:hypothetical protein